MSQTAPWNTNNALQSTPAMVKLYNPADFQQQQQQHQPTPAREASDHDYSANNNNNLQTGADSEFSASVVAPPSNQLDDNSWNWDAHQWNNNSQQGQSAEGQYHHVQDPLANSTSGYFDTQVSGENVNVSTMPVIYSAGVSDNIDNSHMPISEASNQQPPQSSQNLVYEDTGVLWNNTWLNWEQQVPGGTGSAHATHGQHPQQHQYSPALMTSSSPLPPMQQDQSLQQPQYDYQYTSTQSSYGQQLSHDPTQQSYDRHLTHNPTQQSYDQHLPYDPAQQIYDHHYFSNSSAVDAQSEALLRSQSGENNADKHAGTSVPGQEQTQTDINSFPQHASYTHEQFIPPSEDAHSEYVRHRHAFHYQDSEVQQDGQTAEGSDQHNITNYHEYSQNYHQGLHGWDPAHVSSTTQNMNQQSPTAPHSFGNEHSQSSTRGQFSLSNAAPAQSEPDQNLSAPSTYFKSQPLHSANIYDPATQHAVGTIPSHAQSHAVGNISGTNSYLSSSIDTSNSEFLSSSDNSNLQIATSSEESSATCNTTETTEGNSTNYSDEGTVGNFFGADDDYSIEQSGDIGDLSYKISDNIPVKRSHVNVPSKHYSLPDNNDLSAPNTQQMSRDLVNNADVDDVTQALDNVSLHSDVNSLKSIDWDNSGHGIQRSISASSSSHGPDSLPSHVQHSMTPTDQHVLRTVLSQQHVGRPVLSPQNSEGKDLSADSHHQISDIVPQARENLSEAYSMESYGAIAPDLVRHIHGPGEQHNHQSHTADIAPPPTVQRVFSHSPEHLPQSVQHGFDSPTGSSAREAPLPVAGHHGFVNSSSQIASTAQFGHHSPHPSGLLASLPQSDQFAFAHSPDPAAAPSSPYPFERTEVARFGFHSKNGDQKAESVSASVQSSGSIPNPASQASVPLHATQTSPPMGIPHSEASPFHVLPRKSHPNDQANLPFDYDREPSDLMKELHIDPHAVGPTIKPGCFSPSAKIDHPSLQHVQQMREAHQLSPVKSLWDTNNLNMPGNTIVLSPVAPVTNSRNTDGTTPHVIQGSHVTAPDLANKAPHQQIRDESTTNPVRSPETMPNASNITQRQEVPLSRPPQNVPLTQHGVPLNRSSDDVPLNIPQQGIPFNRSAQDVPLRSHQQPVPLARQPQVVPVTRGQQEYSFGNTSTAGNINTDARNTLHSQRSQEGVNALSQPHIAEQLDPNARKPGNQDGPRDNRDVTETPRRGTDRRDVNRSEHGRHDDYRDRYSQQQEQQQQQQFHRVSSSASIDSDYERRNGYRSRIVENENLDTYRRPPSRADSLQDERERYDPRYQEHYGQRRGYGEHYDRPRSRHDAQRVSRPSSRAEEPSRAGQGYDEHEYNHEYDRYKGDGRPASRSGREERPPSRQDDEDYYDRERASRYRRARQTGYDSEYDAYGRDRREYYASVGRTDPYYDEYHSSRYNRGYYEELGYYNKNQYESEKSQGAYIGPADSQYDEIPVDRSSQYSRISARSRGSTPAQELEDINRAQFAHDFHEGRGSRPQSRGSYYEESPIYPASQDSHSLTPEEYARYYYEKQKYDENYRRYYEEYYKQLEEAKAAEVEKFQRPHMAICFCPSGQLVVCLPNRPKEGQPAVIEIQDTEALHTDNWEAEELKKFPGPLIKGETHKNDVLVYCQARARDCRENIQMVDHESAELTWRFLELLIKQNGTVIGSDIADLLLEGHEPTTVEYKTTGMKISGSVDNLLANDTQDPEENSLINASHVTSDRSVVNTHQHRSSGISTDEVTDRFRHLLLYGRKKDALDWGMKHALWGHALFLASKMDNRTHANVMIKFANSSIRMNDPLQSLYQLMSGRQPAATTCISDEKWGDWRPHLAMMLSNHTSRSDVDRKSIITLGDTLAASGRLHASHFCYLMAQAGFGTYSKKSSKLVLIGASHSLELSEFTTNLAIQRTEVYEYALSLGNPMSTLPKFQPYKLLYASRLADYGYAQEVLRYCEIIATTVQQAPGLYHLAFVKQLCQLSCRLKYHDPQRLQIGYEIDDPYWLQLLERTLQGLEDGSIQAMSGAATPMGYGTTTTSSENGEVGGLTSATPDYSLMQASGAGYGVGVDTSTYQQQQYDYSLAQQQQLYQQAGYDSAGQYVPNSQYSQTTDQSQQQTDTLSSYPAGQVVGQDQQPQQQLQSDQQLTYDPNSYQYDPSQSLYTQGYGHAYQNQEQITADVKPEIPAQSGDYSANTGMYPNYSQGQAVPPDQSSAYSTVAPPGDQPGSGPVTQHSPDASTLPPSSDAVDSGGQIDYFGMSTQQPSDDGQHRGNIKFIALHNVAKYRGSLDRALSCECDAESVVPARRGSVPGNVPRKQLSLLALNNSDTKIKIWSPSPSQATSSTGFQYGGYKPPSVLERQRSTSESSTQSVNSVKAAPNNPVPMPRQTIVPPPSHVRDKPKENKGHKGGGHNKSFLSGFFNKFSFKSKTDMILPDDKDPSIVWDATKNRWVNTDGDEEDEKPPAPPPRDTEFKAPPSTGSGPPVVNRFQRQKVRGARGQYVDVMNPGGTSNAKSPPAPANLFNVMPNASAPPGVGMPNIFVPGPATDSAIAEPAPPNQVKESDVVSNSVISTANRHHSRSSSLSSSAREVQQIITQDPPEDEPAVDLSSNITAPPQTATAPPISAPIMFDPSKFNMASTGNAAGPVGGLRYGQRRVYPK